MTAHTPITGKDLDEIKSCLLAYRQEMDKETPDLAPFLTVMARMLAVDLPRCIAEIERLTNENDSLRNETARIILLAEEQYDPNSNTYSVKFTRELLDELKALLPSTNS